MDNKREIAVIGAGIIGINCALALQSKGYQVTLFDKNGIAAGCSKANAGHFATEQVFPLANKSLLWQLPKMLLDPLGPVALDPKYLFKAAPWFLKFIANMSATKQRQNISALQSLNKQAIDDYRPILKEANAEHLLVSKGSLLVFEQTPVIEIKKQLQQFKQAGIGVELLNKEQLTVLEPNLSEQVQYALYFTDVGHTGSPFQICTTLANLSFSKGTTFLPHQVTNILFNKNKITIESTEQSADFDDVVIASGAWSKALLQPLGYNLPIEAERGYSLDLTNTEIEPELTRPVASAERKFIMTPMSHGLRLSGTAEFAGLEAKANMQRADLLYQHANKMLKQLPSFEQKNAQDSQRWMGCRPSLPDSLPVICQAPKHKNLFLALGHQHLGLTLGATTGKLVAQLIQKEQPDIDLAPFCISRFN